MTKMTEIEKVAEKFNNDLEAVAKELKRVQSLKCRLKKQKGKKTKGKKKIVLNHPVVTFGYDSPR